MKLTSLSPELLSHICSYCCLKELLSIRVVSKQLKRIVAENRLWKQCIAMCTQAIDQKARLNKLKVSALENPICAVNVLSEPFFINLIMKGSFPCLRIVEIARSCEEAALCALQRQQLIDFLLKDVSFGYVSIANIATSSQKAAQYFLESKDLVNLFLKKEGYKSVKLQKIHDVAEGATFSLKP